jgi:hypothetical protein
MALARTDVKEERIAFTAYVVLRLPILVTLMTDAIRSSETFLTGATRGNVPEDGILHDYRRENLKSYIELTG